MSVPRHLRAAGLVAAFGLAAAPVRAPLAAPRSGKAAEQAQRFEKKAKAAYKRKRWDEAVAAFELAYGAVPEARFLHNIGRAYEKKGDLVTAIEYVQRYVAEEQDPEEREDGEATLQILRTRLVKGHGELRLTSTPPGAVVRLRSSAASVDGATPLTKWLAVGAWRMALTMDGHGLVEREFVVEAGKSITLAVTLVPEGAEPVEPAPEPPPEPAPRPVAAATPTPELAPEPAPPPEPPAEQSAGPSLGTWAVLGGGAALLAGGAVFGVMTNQAK